MNYNELLEKAKIASTNAYAPFSNFRVGACVLMKSGNIYCGCNVENSSYGMTICAERNAITTAVASGDREIEAIAIYSPDASNCLPCGACRQFIFEFSPNQDAKIITEGEDTCYVKTISEIFPDGFRL
jgi:cytidine deaminase